MSVIETDRKSIVNPSSDRLDFHLAELEEECARFVALISTLRSSWNEDMREVIEGDLYASLHHLGYHALPALREWDRLTDELPSDEEDHSE